MDAISKVGGNNNTQMMQQMMEARHAEPTQGAASSENTSKAASAENTQEAAPADEISAPNTTTASPEVPQVESCNMSEEAMSTGANEESGANMAELLQGMQK